MTERKDDCSNLEVARKLPLKLMTERKDDCSNLEVARELPLKLMPERKDDCSNLEVAKLMHGRNDHCPILEVAREPMLSKQMVYRSCLLYFIIIIIIYNVYYICQSCTNKRQKFTDEWISNTACNPLVIMFPEPKTISNWLTK